MAASYPNTIVTLASHSDNTDTIFATDINTPNAEIVAIETGLLSGFQHDLLPLTDDTRSLGSTSKRWLKAWLQDLDFDGALTVNGSTGTATTVLHGNASGVPTFAAVALATDVSGVLPAANGGSGVLYATDCSNTARFAQAVTGAGAVVFDTSGMQIQTGVTGSALARMLLVSNASGNVFAGSPRFTAAFSLTTKGSDGQFFVGLGPVTITTTAITFTDQHIGFKITWSASGTASLFGTQSDGTESASAALTTVVAGDLLELMLQVNGSASVDYFWRKNGGAFSAATNVATHVPTSTTNANGWLVGGCDANVASASTMTLLAASYQR